MDLNDGTNNDGGDAGTAEDLIGGGSSGDAAAAAQNTDGSSADGGGAAGDDFLAQFSTDTGDGESASLQDWVKASGVKDVAGLAKIARDNMQALRESGRIKVPTDGATDQEIADYRSAIGVPESADGYALPEFKGSDGSPVPVNTEMTQRIFQAAHKLGGPKGLIEGLVKGEIEAQIAEHDAVVAELEKKAGEHVRGWGGDKDAKLAQVNAAAKEAGLTREDMAYLRGMPSGPGKMLDMLAKFGTNFSEDALVKGDRKSFGMDAKQAQSELDAMKTDPAIADKIVVPGTAENLKYERLLKIVAEAADRAAVEN